MKTAKFIASALSSFSLALFWASYAQVSNAQVFRSYAQLGSFVGGCLDANTGGQGRGAYMRPCDTGQNANLQWYLQPVYYPNFQLVEFFIRTKTTGRCLDANTGRLGRNAYLRNCNSSNRNLLWNYNSRSQFVTKTTGYCLDANTGQLGRPAYMRPCDSGRNYNLRWSQIFHP